MFFLFSPGCEPLFSEYRHGRLTTGVFSDQISCCHFDPAFAVVSFSVSAALAFASSCFADAATSGSCSSMRGLFVQRRFSGGGSFCSCGRWSARRLEGCVLG